jgi:hypothetical protein
MDFFRLNSLIGAGLLLAYSLIAGCSLIEPRQQSSTPANNNLLGPENFDVALIENQRALAEGRMAPDVALYNIGVVSVHSANPKRDHPRALQSFTTLVKEYPTSPRAEEAKIWIQALEQIQKNNEELKKVAEEKRAILRERDQLTQERNLLSQERNQLAQERNKLKSEIEKSRQLDADIEKRRRQTLKR